MNPFAPDASVAVKWILAEEDSVKATALLLTDASICAPHLLRVEVAAAVIRRHRLGQIDEEYANTLLSRADAILAERRIRYVEDGALLKRASEIALKIKHALQDCLYIACAEREEADLVTADAALHKRASAAFSFVKRL